MSEVHIAFSKSYRLQAFGDKKETKLKKCKKSKVELKNNISCLFSKPLLPCLPQVGFVPRDDGKLN